MDVRTISEQEQLADELKHLVGYGAKPNHVLAKTTLRGLVERKYADHDLETPALKQVIISELTYAARLIAEAESVCELLMLGGYFNLTATRRREDVIRRDGYHCNVETFRRPEGPEMELMRRFAKVLYIELAIDED